MNGPFFCTAAVARRHSSLSRNNNIQLPSTTRSSMTLVFQMIFLLLLSSTSAARGGDAAAASWTLHPPVDKNNDNNAAPPTSFPEECFDTTDPHRYDPLACWFFRWQIFIPDQSFKEGLLHIHIRDLVCTNFTVAALQSQYQASVVPPDDDNNNDDNQTLPAALHVGLVNVSATCQGTYHTTGLSGKMTATIASHTDPTRSSSLDDDDAPIRWTWMVESNSTSVPAVPVALHSVDCATRVQVPLLEFSGSLSSHAIELFRGRIRKYVAATASEELCPALLEQMVDPLATQYLEKMNQFLQKYIDNDDHNYNNNYATATQRHLEQQSETEQSNVVTDTLVPLVDWSTQAPLLIHGLEVVNHVLQKHLNQGFFPHLVHARQQNNNNFLLQPWGDTRLDASQESSCGLFQGWNGIFHLLLTNDDDDDDGIEGPKYSLPLPRRLHNISFAWPPTTTTETNDDNDVTVDDSSSNMFHVNFSQVVLHGPALDHWEDMQFFFPHVHQASVARGNETARVERHQHDDDNNNNRTLHSKNGAEKNAFTSRLYAPTWLAVTLQIDLRLVSSSPDERRQSSQAGASPVHDAKGDARTTTTDLTENISVTWNLTHVDVNNSFTVLVDRDVWAHNLTMGVLLDVLREVWETSNGAKPPRSALECLRHSIVGFSAPTLTLDTILESILIAPQAKRQNASPKESVRHNHVVTGRLEQDVDNLMNNALQLLLSEYPQYWTAVLAGLVTGPLRSGVNGFFERVVVRNETHSSDAVCSGHHDSGNQEPKWLDLNHVQPLTQLNDYLSKDRNVQHLNDYLQCAADSVTIPGTISFDLNEMLSYLSDDDIGNLNEDSVAWKIHELDITDVGRIQKIAILQPSVDGLELINALEYGLGDEVNDTSLFPQVTVQMELDIASFNTSAFLNLTLFWDSLNLAGSSMIRYNLNQLYEYSLERVFQHGHCLLVPVHEFDTHLVTQPLNGLELLIEMDLSKTDDNGDVQLISHLVFSTLDYPAVQEGVDRTLSWLVNSTRDFVDLASLYSLSRAKDFCDGHPPVPTSHRRDEDDGQEAENDDVSMEAILLMLLAAILLAQPAVLLLRPKNPPAEDDGHVDQMYSSFVPLLEENRDQRRSQPRANSAPVRDSLMESEEIPLIVRIGLPMIVILTIALLLAGNLSVGASVELSVTMGSHQFQLPSLFEFNLINTAKRMWEAQIYPLFLLVTLFSGVWPYAKLFLILYSWITPTNKLSTQKRGRLLLALDALGKFSLVDAYVLVLMMVSFAYHASVAGIEVDVTVVAHYGFYGFVIATGLSLLIGHVAVYFHRRMEMGWLLSEQRGPLANAAEPLLLHKYDMRGRRRGLSYLAILLLGLFWVGALVLLRLGVTREWLVFEIGGAAGLVMDSNRSAYSLISLGTSIPAAAGDAQGVGPTFLMGIYFFYAVFAPFACLVFLFMLFTFSLPLKDQVFLLSLVEIANAWSAVEVFCLSVIASLLEISTFSTFIIGSKCDVLNNILSEIIVDQDSTKCYSVHASVRKEVWFLLVGAILNSALVSVSLRLAQAAMEERRRRQNDATSVDRLASVTPANNLVSFLAGSSITSWLVFASSGRNASLPAPLEGVESEEEVVFGDHTPPESPWSTNHFNQRWDENGADNETDWN